eukprot:m51a1_g7261 putative cortexillin ii (674) ;mRNA; f:181080-184295
MSRTQIEKAWERVQEKAFTKWMDDTLKARDPALGVRDLRTDLRTGLSLIHFFEQLSGRTVRDKYERSPGTKIHDIQNLHIALVFLEKEMGMRNPGCSAENIWDAEEKGIKMILGLLWTLYRKYRMAVEGGDGKKKGREEDALLEWVRQTTAGYEGVSIQNFRSSFNDGLAFLALAHTYDKEHCPFSYDELRNSGKERQELLKIAFDYAEQYMGVNKLLEEEEVAGGMLDERALALYASLYYHAFKSKADMLAMQQQLGASSLSLALEQKGKDELIKMNLELNDTLALRLGELEEEKKTSQRKDDELRTLGARMAEMQAALELKDAELAARNAEVARRDVDIAALERTRNEALLRTQHLEEQVRQLQMQLEALQSLLEDERRKRAKLEAELRAAQDELQRARQQLEHEQRLKEGGEKELSLKLTEAESRVRELEKALGKLHEDAAAADVKISDLKGRVRKSQKAADEKQRAIDESARQFKINHTGLAALRANLERHITDIHKWQKFLEGGAADVTDPDDIIQAAAEEMERMGFVEQLNHVSGLLEKENTTMSKLLAERRALYANEPRRKKEKKDATAPAVAATATPSASASAGATPTPEKAKEVAAPEKPREEREKREAAPEKVKTPDRTKEKEKERRESGDKSKDEHHHREKREEAVKKEHSDKLRPAADKDK